MINKHLTINYEKSWNEYQDPAERLARRIPV